MCVWGPKSATESQHDSLMEGKDTSASFEALSELCVDFTSFDNCQSFDSNDLQNPSPAGVGHFNDLTTPPSPNPVQWGGSPEGSIDLGSSVSIVGILSKSSLNPEDDQTSDESQNPTTEIKHQKSISTNDVQKEKSTQQTEEFNHCRHTTVVEVIAESVVILGDCAESESKAQNPTHESGVTNGPALEPITEDATPASPESSVEPSPCLENESPASSSSDLGSSSASMGCSQSFLNRSTAFKKKLNARLNLVVPLPEGDGESGSNNPSTCGSTGGSSGASVVHCELLSLPAKRLKTGEECVWENDSITGGWFYYDIKGICNTYTPPPRCASDYQPPPRVAKRPRRNSLTSGRRTTQDKDKGESPVVKKQAVEKSSTCVPQEIGWAEIDAMLNANDDESDDFVDWLTC